MLLDKKGQYFNCLLITSLFPSLTYSLLSSHLCCPSPSHLFLAHITCVSAFFHIHAILTSASSIYFLPSSLPHHFSPIILTSNTILYTLSTPPSLPSLSLEFSDFAPILHIHIFVLQLFAPGEVLHGESLHLVFCQVVLDIYTGTTPRITPEQRAQMRKVSWNVPMSVS